MSLMMSCKCKRCMALTYEVMSGCVMRPRRSSSGQLPAEGSDPGSHLLPALGGGTLRGLLRGHAVRQPAATQPVTDIRESDANMSPPSSYFTLTPPPPPPADGGGQRVPGEGPAAGGGARQRALSDGERDGGGVHHAETPPLQGPRAAGGRPDLRHHTSLLQPSASWVKEGSFL